MGQLGGKKRGAWFWAGVALLSLSALIWLFIIVAIISEPSDASAGITAGVLLTIIPIGIGIYCLRRHRRRGKKAPTIEVQQGPEPTYASQPVTKSAQRSSIGSNERTKLEIDAAMSKVQETALIFGIIVASLAVIGSVFSLPIPGGASVFLLFSLLAGHLVVLFKWPKGSKVRGLGMKELLKRYWVYTLPYIACGIILIYTIIGIILGNIEWVYPGGYKGP